MIEMKPAPQRQSDIELTFPESDDENYESYRRNSLPEGYTAYNENGLAVCARSDSDYEGAETPDPAAKPNSCSRKKSCCKIGWLSKM